MDPLFEDVFPIENGDIPASYVSLPEAISLKSRNFPAKNGRLFRLFKGFAAIHQ